MSYEFTAVEQAMDPQQIKKAFKRLHNAKKQLMPPRQCKENNGYRQVYYTAIEKFKTLFTKEFNRIHASINKHKIEDNEQEFIKYVDIHYSELLKLYNKKDARKPDDKIINAPDFNSNYQHYATIKMHYYLQSLLVIPLKEFMEARCRKELIETQLFNSPLETFLTALMNNHVRISRHGGGHTSNSYRPVYSHSAKRMFTLEYNGHHVEALYYKDLEKKYEEFMDYLDIFLETGGRRIEKVKFLNKLKIRISDLNSLFIEEPHPGQRNSNHLMHHRTDAFDNLSLELHNKHILKDLNPFRDALLRFTEIQSIFVSRALKFIKAQIRLLALDNMANGYNDPPQEVLSEEPLPETFPKLHQYGKLQWMGNENQLIAFFYDATTQVKADGEPILKATKKQIERLLTENFFQKDADPINPRTINAIFVPSNVLKRPSANKRITIPAP